LIEENILDPLKSIGRKLKGDEKRDAIHIAVLPAILGDDSLYAGKRVKLRLGEPNVVVSATGEHDSIGIVDPFLDGYNNYPKKGDRVWIFMNPGMTTGMRHEWTNPQVDNLPKFSGSEAEIFIRNFAEEWNFDYHELIANASAESESEWGNYITAHGVDLHHRSELGDDHDKFWECLEVLTGKKFDAEHRERFGWSCSC
jgi:hypothetical protein